MSSNEEWTKLQLLRALCSCLVKRPVYLKQNRYFKAKVFKVVSSEGRAHALKTVRPLDKIAGQLLSREHEFLKVLHHKGVVHYRGHMSVGSRYFLVTDWIEGCVLEGNTERVRGFFRRTGEAHSFAKDCREILRVLGDAGIVHRDIRAKNFIVDEGRPVLFDFGWAIWRNESGAFSPEELVNADDERAMDEIIRQIS